MSASFVVLWALLAAATFGAASAAGSLLAFAAWKATGGNGGAPRARARLLFALRLAPTVLGAGAALLVFTPAWLALESRRTQEVPGLALVAAAALASGLAALGIVRGGRAAWRAWRTARAWERDAERVAVPGTPLSVSRIDDPFPVVALAGIVSPRIYVARQVLHACDDSELAAVVRHEEAHLRARDNARILLMRSCGDLLALVPAGRAIEREWAAAAEAAADESASPSPDAALDLASALVKVARLAGPAPLLAPVSAFFETGAIAARVERLTRPRADDPAPLRMALASAVLVLIPALAVAAVSLAWVHGVAETLVHL